MSKEFIWRLFIGFIFCWMPASGEAGPYLQSLLDEITLDAMKHVACYGERIVTQPTTHDWTVSHSSSWKTKHFGEDFEGAIRYRDQKHEEAMRKYHKACEELNKKVMMSSALGDHRERVSPSGPTPPSIEDQGTSPVTAVYCNGCQQVMDHRLVKPPFPVIERDEEGWMTSIRLEVDSCTVSPCRVFSRNVRPEIVKLFNTFRGTLTWESWLNHMWKEAMRLDEGDLRVYVVPSDRIKKIYSNEIKRRGKSVKSNADSCNIH